MTSPPAPTSAQKIAWYARPGIVLSLLGALVLVSALLARTSVSGRNGDPRLTTYSTDPLGAKLLFELANRFGFEVQRERRDLIPGQPTTIYAVLDPVVALRRNDVHNILEFVRNGGALLVALGNGTSVLADSLKIAADGRSGLLESNDGSRECAERPRVQLIGDGLWLGSASLSGLRGAAVDSVSGFTTFSRIRTLREKEISGVSNRTYQLVPAFVGYGIGKGRVAVTASADVFRNDALRDCRQGLDIAVVNALQFLQSDRAGARNRIVFDEFHQQRDAGSGVVALVETYLGSTPSGHSVLQLCIAGLLLILAGAARTLPPRDDEDLVVRRSPLEHVDALARAYAQVDATRTAAMRLVSGVQRRLDRGATRSSKRGGALTSGDLFLARIADVKPALTADVQVVRNALETSVSKSELKEVAKAIERIEDALTRT